MASATNIFCGHRVLQLFYHNVKADHADFADFIDLKQKTDLADLV